MAHTPLQKEKTPDGSKAGGGSCSDSLRGPKPHALPFVSMFARLTLTTKLTNRKLLLFQWLHQFYTRPAALQTAI